MSEDETVERNLNKRKAESGDESDDDQVQCKRGRISPPSEGVEVDQSNSEVIHSRRNIEEAIQALDRIQYELNMGNVLDDSPESSDQDTPPQSEDESVGEDELNQAHALGFAACIRETFKFLDQCGISESDPIYKQLKGRFIGIGTSN